MRSLCGAVSLFDHAAARSLLSFATIAHACTNAQTHHPSTTCTLCLACCRLIDDPLSEAMLNAKYPAGTDVTMCLDEDGQVRCGGRGAVSARLRAMPSPLLLPGGVTRAPGGVQALGRAVPCVSCRVMHCEQGQAGAAAAAHISFLALGRLSYVPFERGVTRPPAPPRHLHC